MHGWSEDRATAQGICTTNFVKIGPGGTGENGWDYESGCQNIELYNRNL